MRSYARSPRILLRNLVPSNRREYEAYQEELSVDHGGAFAKYRDDPVRFNDVILGRPSYWERQEEICRAVVEHRTTVVPTGNSVGKSYCAAGLILWWLYSRPGSLVVATAPSQTLLGTVLFKEVRRALAGARVSLLGRITDSPAVSPQTVITPYGSMALGIATRGTERLSGQHATELLIVVDEASGIEDEIWEALDSQNPTRQVIFGNPLRAEGRFRDLSLRADRELVDPLLSPVDRVHQIRIPSTESPDIALDRSPRGLADRGFLDTTRRQYGDMGLWWRTHVLAQFPEVSAEALIPESWLDWATRPEHRSDLKLQRRPGMPTSPACGPTRIAVDLGEGIGRDRTVVLVRDDRGILDVDASNTTDLPQAAHIVRQMVLKWQVAHDHISYDKLGIGASFVNHLYSVGIKTARPYAGEGRPHDRNSFTNVRTECAWLLRNRLDPNWCPDSRSPHVTQPPFHIPCAGWWPQMREELKTLSYDLVGKQTRLIPKKDHSERLGRSPDLADAFMQSFAKIL